MGRDTHHRELREAAQNAQVAEHAETIAAIRARADNQRSPSQRYVESFTATIGRPATIAILLALIAVWIAWNGYEHASGRKALDEPPFFWLQGVVALYAALISTFVLATQNREKRHGEQRAYLELQVNLLAEQKTAKIIELLEELRRDMPTVRDRVDHQADAMQLPVDTKAVLSVLEETMDSASVDAAPPSDEPKA
ncbi:MAG: hypothetical protein JWP87_2715 [Labilithrix sp.]|jgi:uncharacterized membrane protein|nr:hypothetical protein [Labilithrix sp.]